ncbi:short-chain dehydrogenase/reductase SDR [Streptomyces malaysiensis]|uniref:Short-chain dehydrogenase/reductase SDR n=1 Tax=Streptomyces malaysiensis TaxID=92644 RepID=A0A7X5X9D6_STRMQ|nr:short-chain dehydrogenase/reductase SDR [Streptomyces malaysiensis]
MEFGAFLDRVDHFDADFFGISPREAGAMDPQQRLMLELGWETLEDAGLTPARIAHGRTGVFVGAINDDYATLLRRHGDSAVTHHTLTDLQRGMIANRLSYLLGTRGPSMVVDSGQSSSLVAVHTACQSLRNGECDTALAGGVHLNLAYDGALSAAPFGGLSPDGRCFAFDARANGFVRGEGGSLVLLKPLARALADGDRIHGVLRGGAVNNDGGGDSLTTPSRTAQAEVLRQAYAAAGVGPDEVQYVELHGTGTAVGDPIEAAALAEVIGAARTKDRPLLVGSAKTNVGHLEGAAGITGLIKVLGGLAVGTLRRGEGGTRRLLLSLARLWVHGAAPDWAKVFAGTGARRTELPGRAFQRRRHWFGTMATGAVADTAPGATGGTEAPGAPGAPGACGLDVAHQVRAQAAAVLGHTTAAELDTGRTFKDLGFDSISLSDLCSRVNTALGTRLSPAALFSHPTPARLAEHLAATGPAPFDRPSERPDRAAPPPAARGHRHRALCPGRPLHGRAARLRPGGARRAGGAAARRGRAARHLRGRPPVLREDPYRVERGPGLPGAAVGRLRADRREALGERALQRAADGGVRTAARREPDVLPERGRTHAPPGRGVRGRRVARVLALPAHREGHPRRPLHDHGAPPAPDHRGHRGLARRTRSVTDRVRGGLFPSPPLPTTGASPLDPGGPGAKPLPRGGAA